MTKAYKLKEKENKEKEKKFIFLKYILNHLSQVKKH